VRQAWYARQIAPHRVLHVTFRASQFGGDFLNREDLRCVLHASDRLLLVKPPGHSGMTDIVDIR
jgi:hypothetical protein